MHATKITILNISTLVAELNAKYRRNRKCANSLRALALCLENETGFTSGSTEWFFPQWIQLQVLNLVFAERRKAREPGENRRSKEENQQASLLT